MNRSRDASIKPKVDIDIDNYLTPFVIDIDSIIEDRIHSINMQLRLINDETLKNIKRKLKSLRSSLGSVIIYYVNMNIFDNINLSKGIRFKYESYNIGFTATSNTYNAMKQFMISIVESITNDNFIECEKRYRVHMNVLFNYLTNCICNDNITKIKLK